MTSTHRIVVGIDGSPGSQRALRWAIDEAAFRDAELEVFYIWQVPSMGSLYMMPLDTQPYEEAAKQTLEEALAAEDLRPLKREVQRRLVKGGAPAWTLANAGKDADMIVVGSRGLGGFKGLLLGSVSQQVAHHATCPVVVVPEASASVQPHDGNAAQR